MIYNQIKVHVSTVLWINWKIKNKALLFHLHTVNELLREEEVEAHIFPVKTQWWSNLVCLSKRIHYRTSALEWLWTTNTLCACMLKHTHSTCKHTHVFWILTQAAQSWISSLGRWHSCLCKISCLGVGGGHQIIRWMSQIHQLKSRSRIHLMIQNPLGSQPGHENNNIDKGH